MFFKQYWNNTRSPLYSFFFTVPLFFIYEVGILLSSSTALISMRNGADALMRQILSALGFNGFYWIGGIFFIGFLITYLFQKQYWSDIEIESKYSSLQTLFRSTSNSSADFIIQITSRNIDYD